MAIEVIGKPADAIVAADVERLLRAWAIKDAEKAAAGGLLEVLTLAIPGLGWPLKFLKWVFTVLLLEEALTWMRSLASWFSGGILFTVARLWPNATITGVGYIADEITRWTPAAVDLAAMTLEQIMAVKLDRDTLKEGASKTGTRAFAVDLGGQFMQLVPLVFNVPAAIDDHQTRTGAVGSLQNLAAFMGTNLNFQLRSLTISTISSMFGWEPLRHLEGLHQSINWAFGFGWMSWAVMSEYMNVTVNPGLRRFLNSQVKHVDLTAAQATQAVIRDKIEPGLFNQILDNDGVRDDIRNVLIDLAAKDLSDSELRQLYEHGSLSLADVNARVRAQGFLEQEASYKTETIENERLWALQKELLNVQEQQFAHGLITEAQFRNAMIPLHFTQAEEDIEVDIAKAKATLRPGTKAKAIGGSFSVAPWKIKPGQPVVVKWNIRNAEQVTITDLGTVSHRGERVVYPTVSKSYYLDATAGQDTERWEEVVEVAGAPVQRRPTVSFSASPSRPTIGSPVELKWRVTNADTIAIDQIGPVAESGAQFVFPALPTLYTLRATNAAGTTVVVDGVFPQLPSIPELDKLKPTVSFSISPGVITGAQPRAEMKWVTSKADRVVLIDPDGVEHEVGKEGIYIIQDNKSVIWGLRATNAFGDTVRHEALIYKAPAEDEPEVDPATLPPQLSFSVSPQTAAPGDSLFLYWTIALAPTGTLVLPDGTTRLVGTSGSQTYLAPPGEGNYEFRLQAENGNGPSSLSVNVVVSTAK